jgi:amino acid permease
VEFDIITLPQKSDGVNMVVENYAKKTLLVRAGIMLTLMILMLPLALLKNLSALRYFSMGNLFVLFYIILTTLVQAPKFIKKYKNDP